MRNKQKTETTQDTFIERAGTILRGKQTSCRFYRGQEQTNSTATDRHATATAKTAEEYNYSCTLDLARPADLQTLADALQMKPETLSTQWAYMTPDQTRNALSLALSCIIWTVGTDYRNGSKNSFAKANNAFRLNSSGLTLEECRNELKNLLNGLKATELKTPKAQDTF